MTDAPIVVIGGGLVGLTTAYEIATRGRDVVVVEAAEGVGLQTSFANGALLTPSMSDPWNAPGVLGRLLGSVFDPHSAMKLNLSATPGLIDWGLKFISNSAPNRFAAATRASYRLARYSVDCLDQLRSDLALAYRHSDAGAMKVFSDENALRASRAVAAELQPLGLRCVHLDQAATIRQEPALAPVRDRLVGALYFPDDRSGDAHLFCRALADRLLSAGGRIRTGFPVSRITMRDSAAVGVVSNGGEEMAATAVIVAAGGQASRLVRPLGVRLAIQPAKGYTLTFDAAPAALPAMPVIDDAMHAVVVPLGKGLRVAGTAEFAGDDLTVRPERIDNLWALLVTLYPMIAEQIDRRSGRPWAGLRPMSADGLPYVGPTPVHGLYANAGHGHLGWTLAAGSARLLADQLTGATPQIDPAPYRVER